MSYNEGYGLDDYINGIIEKIRRRIDKTLQLSDLALQESSWDLQEGCMEPLVQVTEKENELVVTADLPLVEKENIKINADEQSVEISAEMSKKISYEKWGASQRRATFCHFHKKIFLPSKINPEEGRASFKNGILILNLPKKKQAFRLVIE